MSGVFIAGASGYTGRALIPAWSAAGQRVVAHIREGSAQRTSMETHCRAHNAEMHVCAWTMAAMEEALAEHSPRFVFACLGTTKKRASKENESYESVDYGLTRLLMDACEGMAEPPRFVYLSAVGAERPTRNAYMAARHRVESELAATRLRWTVVRPSFITGPDRAESRPMERAGAAAVDGLLGALSLVGGRGVRDRYASLSGEALAAAMVRLALADEAAGKNAAHAGAALRG